MTLQKIVTFIVIAMLMGKQGVKAAEKQEQEENPYADEIWLRDGVARQVTKFRRVRLTPRPGNTHFVAANCESQPSWWGDLIVFHRMGDKIDWIAAFPEEYIEGKGHYVVACKWRYLERIGFWVLEVISSTHMGNGSLWLFTLEDHNLHLLLQTPARGHSWGSTPADLGEAFGNDVGFLGEHLAVSYPILKGDKYESVVLSGTIGPYEEVEKSPYSRPYKETWTWDPKMRVFDRRDPFTVARKIAVANANDPAENLAQTKHKMESWLGSETVAAWMPYIGLDSNNLLVVTGFPKTIDTLEPLRGLNINHLGLSGTAVKSLEPLRGMVLETLIIDGTPVSDISPLRQIPLRRLHMKDTLVSDLSPLSYMGIQYLDVSGTKVEDLTPLGRLQLAELRLKNTKIRVLSPLTAQRICVLDVSGTDISDLSSLRSTTIAELAIQNTKLKDLTPLFHLTYLKKLRISKLGAVLEPLRNHPSLEYIGYDEEPYLPVKEFWAEYDARQTAESRAK